MRVVLCCLVVLALVAGSNAVNLQRAFSRGPAACPVSPAMAGDEKCTAEKGTCFFVGSCDCVGGEVVSKMCGGSAGRKCCKGGALQQKAEAAAFNEVIAQCKKEPQTDADSKCKAAGGICIDSKKCGCDQGFKAGLCGGAGSRRCCVGSVVREDNRADVDPRVQGQAPAPARGALKIKCADLFAAYPQGESPVVRDMILPGPAGTNDWISNTCALRMSFTLSTLGVNIVEKTQTDPDTKRTTRLRLSAAKNPKTGAPRYAYFRVAVLDQFMREKYGLPAKEIVKPGKDKLDNLGVDPAEFKDLKGIIRFNIPIWSDASGHFDIWDGQNMLEGHHNNAETKARYFSNARSVAVWACEP